MSTDNLTFSLVVSTTDRANALQTLLRGLEQQAYPNFELIVVVGPTKDHTLDVLAPYQDRITILHCPKANLGQSRNIGLAAARGDIVAFVDDDCVPCWSWLIQLARLFANPQVDATGGVVYLVHPNSPIMQHRQGIISALAEQVDNCYTILDQLIPTGEGRMWVERMMGTNMAFRRSALLEIGGFDEFFEWLFDDSDVAFRLVSSGRISQPVQEAVVYHIPASSRHRVAGTYRVKWWIQTKSIIYFCFKNGPLAGHSWQEITARGFWFAWKHWQWSKQLWREGKLSYFQHLEMRFQEVRSALSGIWYGLFQPRRLLPRPTLPMLSEPITPFQNNQSAYQPAVDPINGQRANITLVEPPLRICLLSSAYPPTEYEGVGRHTNLMARGLFECGHTVHVVTRGEKHEIAFYDGAYVHRVPRERNRYPRYRLMTGLHYALSYSHAFYEKIKRLQFNDGVQIVDSPIWQLDGLVAAMSHSLPVIVRLQTAQRQVSSIENNAHPELKLIGEAEESLVHRAAHLVPNSQATLKIAQQVYNIQPATNQYTIIPHGIIPVSDEEIRPFNMATPPAQLTVLYVGRLEKRKGIVELFEAMPRVLQQIPNAHFILAGKDNSQSDGFQKQSGLSYPDYFAQKYPELQKSVTFLGYVDEEKLQSLYQSCDLFVAPSLHESFGLIYIEAMNYAKPVIGCRAGGIPEVIDHGVSGLLVEPSAAPALAEGIISLLQSPSKLHDMGLAGRQRVLEKFSYLQMAQQFAAVYRQTIALQQVK